MLRISGAAFLSTGNRFLLARSLSASSIPKDAVSLSTGSNAVKETQDITALSDLLTSVRKRSNPAYHSVVPMRSPVLWSEALFNASAPSEIRTPVLSGTSLQASEPSVSPRNMHDSYTELLLPFSSSPDIFEQYTNASGGIRMGKLLEHLDSLAGSISYKHMLGPDVKTLGTIEERGFYIVTASVDRLDMLAPKFPLRDIRLSGQVIYTGRSSMEVAVKMEATGSGQIEETIMLGRFSMVCRDAKSHLARRVNPLIVHTDEEQSLYSMGKALKRRRHSLAQRSLVLVPPSSSEAEALHSFFLKHGRSPREQGRVWIGNTRLENTMLMFPQERNVHQKIFGGYLMRLAYELAFSNACIFTQQHVRFISLDGISFARPVPIGSILQLTSHVTYLGSSEQLRSLVHVNVEANVIDVGSGNKEMTNDFRFTWCPDDDTRSLPSNVVPRTYREAMLWLEGKRALEIGAEIRGLRGLTLP